MTVTCWDRFMTNNQKKEVFSTRRGTSFCLAAVCLPWVSPVPFWWASPLSSLHSGPSLPLTPALTTTAHDALLTFSPDLIDSMSAGGIGSSRKTQTHWSGHQPPQKGRCGRRGLKMCSSPQTSLPPLQENECSSSLQIDMITCNYECWYYVYFPSRFSHPDLWLPARDVWGCANDSLWIETITENVSRVSSTQNPSKSKWKET